MKQTGTLHRFFKSNRGLVSTGVVSSLQFHCFRIIQTNVISSVENFLNRSYARFESTTTTTTVCWLRENVCVSVIEKERHCLNRRGLQFAIPLFSHYSNKCDI